MYADGVSSTVSVELRARVISDHNHRTIEIISRLIIFIAWSCARAVYVIMSVCPLRRWAYRDLTVSKMALSAILDLLGPHRRRT